MIMRHVSKGGERMNYLDTTVETERRYASQSRAVKKQRSVAFSTDVDPNQDDNLESSAE